VLLDAKRRRYGRFVCSENRTHWPGQALSLFAQCTNNFDADNPGFRELPHTGTLMKTQDLSVLLKTDSWVRCVHNQDA